MSFMNWVRDKTADLKDEVAKHRNREFLDAVVNGCAIVAAADGTVSGPEKQKMLGYIQGHEALRVFKADEVIELFKKAADRMDFDLDIGRAEAMTRILKLRGKTDAAKMMIKVCCAIGASDGSFDKQEQHVVAEMCRALGLNPAEFNLA